MEMVMRIRDLIALAGRSLLDGVPIAFPLNEM